MSIQGRAEAAVKGLALWAGLGVVVLGIVLAGLGFLITGFFIWIASYKPHDIAAAITGGVLFGLAIAVAVIGGIILKKLKKPQPSMLAEFGGIAGTAGRIAGMIIRRDPRKSLIIAVIAGAVAEYITSGDKQRNK